MRRGHGGADGTTMRFTSTTMEHFGFSLEYFMDRPVVDETGLAGKFDFTLKWSPDTMKQGEANEYPGLTTAVREQLGLKLESAKGPVEVLVVDAVSRPSDN